MRGVLIWVLVAFLTATCANVAAFGRAMDIGDADVVQQTTPAVVNVSVWKIRAPEKPGDTPRRIKANGSGFIIDPTGIIVTNKHVIDDAISVTVIFSDNSRVRARLIAAAGMMDVAVLKVDVDHPLPTLKWGNSDALRVGDAVLTVGNPLGLGTSVSAGIVSGLDRDLQDSPFDNYIQTDAVINHGNSGGPLVNREGEVVGIDTALYNTDPNGGFIGIGFAIAADRARHIVDLLLDPSHPQPGWIGVTLEDVTPELAEALDVPGGFIVSKVDPEGPAQRASVGVGDVLSTIGDKIPHDSRGFLWTIAVSKIGQPVRLMVWRDGKQFPVTVTIAPWPNDVLAGGIMGGNMAQAMIQKPPDPGLQLVPITDQARKKYHLSSNVSGVLVSAVDASSEASDLGIVPGDVISVVQGVRVSAPGDVSHAIMVAQEQHRPFIALLVQGASGTRWLSLSVSGTGV